jgi:hypothetical protein
LQDDADDVADDDGTDLQDDVQLTAAAREAAPRMLRLLTVSQTAAWIEAVADDIDEPLAELTDALADARTGSDEDFSALRDNVADDLALTVAGIDAQQDTRVAGEVVALLAKSRAMTAAEFAAKRPVLEHAAKTIIGDIDPLLIVRHRLERDAAELLANPRLGAAIDAWNESAPVRKTHAADDE